MTLEQAMDRLKEIDPNAWLVVSDHLAKCEKALMEIAASGDDWNDAVAREVLASIQDSESA